MITDNERELLATTTSGRFVLRFSRSEHVAERSPQRIPPKGSIILFNEATDQVNRVGLPSMGERGIGVVEEYAKYCVRISLYIKPELRQSTTIRLDDIRLGIFKYVILEDWVYTKSYIYDDLDINSPHADIQKLIRKS